jgi:multicomponent Na+:H+ antiporter subunit F
LAEASVLIFNIAFYIALTAMLLSFIRFLKGPTIADRIVALDTMTVIGISVISFIAFSTRRYIYIDVALVYGLLSFLGVIAFARYMEGGL